MNDFKIIIVVGYEVFNGICLGVIRSGLHNNVKIVLQLPQLFQCILVDLRNQIRINHTVHRLNGNDAIGNRNIEIGSISDDATNEI